MKENNSEKTMNFLRGELISGGSNRVNLEYVTIVKICNILDVQRKDDAFEVEEVFLNQPELLRKVLSDELGKTDEESNCRITLQFLRDTIINGINWYIKQNYERPIFEALNIILPIIANIYSYVRLKMIKDSVKLSNINVSIKDVAEQAKTPLILPYIIFDLENVNDGYVVSCKPREEILVKKSDIFDITGNNILVVGLGGGSDCIQAAMVGKYLLKNCNNVISIRTERTASQDSSGKMNKIRLVYGVEKVLLNDVYLCNRRTHGEGRFFEDLPSKMGMNSYLVINKNDNTLFEKIRSVIQHIENTTNKKIDTIVGVDTGGDCIYPLNSDGTILQATQDLDRCSMEAISRFEELGYKVYTCIVAPGIDSPNGITTEVLKAAEAQAYYPNAEESNNILKTYDFLGMTEKKKERIGKTPFIWQNALEGKTGLITIQLPEYLVLSKENPWIINVTVEPITKSVVFMETSKAIKAISIYE